MIREFQGNYRFLSNFWPVDIHYLNLTFPSVENAYQAVKFLDRDLWPKFTNITPPEAKRLGRKYRIRPNWDIMRIGVMRNLLAKKFAPGTPLAARLISTHPYELQDGNTWNDTYWGICEGYGENNLGKLLMQQRRFLMEPRDVF